MRVLELQGLVGGGGSEVHTFLLSRGLIERGHEVVLFAPEGGTGSTVSEAEKAGCAIERFPLVGTWQRTFDLGLARQLARCVRRDAIDVIHTHLWNADVAGWYAGRWTGTPVVATIHGPTIATTIERRWHHRLHLGYYAAIMRRMQRLIAISEFSRDYVARDLRIPAERIDVVYNCSDVAAYDLQVDRAQIRAEAMGVPADARVLIIVGELTARKGILEFVEVAARVRRTLPDAHFVLVGTGELEEPGKALAAERGVTDCVHFLGWRPDVPELLAASDALAVCSYGEGFGRTITEAMSSRLPVLAFDSGAPRELIVDGETGYLVGEGDVEAFARRTAELLGSSEQLARMGAAGLERARRLFDIDLFVGSTESVLRGAVEGRPRSVESGH